MPIDASFPPETPGVIAVRGADAVRFLNGQMTQEVRELGDATRFSCITDAKGKLQHWVEILSAPDGDTVWVVTPPEEAEAVLARLDRYLIADDAELSDLSGQWHRLRARGDELESAEFSRSSTWPEPSWRDFWSRQPIEGQEVELSAEEIETRRVRLAHPARGKEITAGLLPPEAGLEASSISYRKGCYIGQEVLSRIKTAGKVNRRLKRFEILRGSATEGASLLRDGQVCGVLTSVDPAGQFALGFVKRAALEAVDFQLEGSDPCELRVLP